MASEIGIAFQKVGASAEALHVPFEKVAAIVATISSVTREAPETVGTAVKSILTRIESVKQRGYDSEDGTTINQVATALKAAHVELVGANGQFRDFSTVLDELAKKWTSLDDKTQRYVATTVASTTQQSRFLALMNNYGQVLDLTNQAVNAAGTTQSKYNLYLEGTQSHIDRLKAQMETLFGNTFNSDGIKSIIDTLGGIVSGVDSVVKTFGFLPPVVLLASTAILMFNKNLKGIAEAGWGAAFSSLKGGFESTAVSATSLNLKLLATRLSTIALQATMSLGLSLAITAVVSGIQTLIQHHQKLAEQQRQLEVQNQTVVTSWTTQRDLVNSLVNEYDKLDGTKNRTVDQDKRYLDISSQLSTLMPNLIASIDAKGVAHLKSADAIAKELGYAEKLTKLENEKALTSAKKDFGSDTSNLSDAQSSLDAINRQINTKRTDNINGRSHALSEDQIKSLEIQALGLESQINGSVDSMRGRVLSLSTTVATLAGVKVGDSLSVELKKITDSLNVSGLNSTQLAAKSNEIGKLIVTLDNLKNASSLVEAQRLDKSFLDQAKSAGLSSDAINGLLSSITKGTNIVPEVTKQTIDYDASIKKLDEDLTEAEKSTSTLASAYQKLQNGEQLSVDETLKLVAAHPQLLDYLLQHNGLITDKGAILQQVANIERQARLDEAKGLLDSVTDTFNALESKRKMYQDFYTKVMAGSPLLDSGLFGFGKNTTGLNKDGKVDFSSNGKQFLSQQDDATLKESEKNKKELQLRVDLLSKPIDLSKVNSSSSGNNSASETKRDMDVFARAQKVQDDLLIISDAHLAKYKDTTQAYRSELEKQIPIYQAKQALTHQEADSLRDVNTALQKKLDTEKLNSSQQNTILNQIDSNNNKISTLVTSWNTYDKTISDISNKNSLSLVNEAIDKSADSTKKFDDKIKSLKTSMDSLKTDPAAKIADQNELLKVYSDEQDAIIKTNGELEALSKTLDKNSDAYLKNQDQIDKNKASLQQITADVDSERQKVATQVIDTMKKGIQTEIEAEKSLHDAKIKNIDDATNAAIAAIDKIQQANDENKTLEKDQTALQKLQNERNSYVMDTSNEGISKVADLDQQIATQKEKIDDEQTKTSNRIVKQSLQDQNKSLKDSLDDQSKIKTDTLQNQLNDDTHWLDLQTQLMNGHVEGIQNDMKSLIDGLGTYAQQSIGVAETQISKIKTMMSQIGVSSTNVGNLPPINSNPASSGGSGGSGSAGSGSNTGSGFYVPKDQQETAIIKLMKGFSDKWKSATSPTEKKNFADLNQNWGSQLGATYDSGTGKWSKGGLPLYHDGGEVGITTSMGQKLHKLLNLGQGEIPSILKNGELVLKNPMSAMTNLMNSIKMPDFSNIINKAGSVGGNTATLTMYNTFTGDQKGGQDAIQVMVNGLKRMGINN